MSGVVQDADGRWVINRNFLTPERLAILDRLDEQHRVARAARSQHPDAVVDSAP